MTLPASERDGLADLALLVRAFQISKMLQVAAALGLADRVDDGPKNITALAVECGANASMLLRLCRALAALCGALLDNAGELVSMGEPRTRNSNR
jgi:hypothetical protein